MKQNKYCIECGCELILGDNWTESMRKNHKNKCKSCECKYNRDRYANNPYVRKQQKLTVYKCRKNNPSVHRRANAKWDKNHPESRKKSKAKRKGYDSIFLFDNPFDKDIPVVGHHASDGFVFYIPTNLHLEHYTRYDKEKHRDELQPYIESIYNISYIIIDKNKTVEKTNGETFLGNRTLNPN